MIHFDIVATIQRKVKNMFIADAQVHVWGPNTPERPWRTGHNPRRAAPLTPEDLLREMRAAGVSRAVLVPPYIDCERNDLVLTAAQTYPQQFAVMGRLDTGAPDARAQLARWRAQTGMFGLRCSFNRPELSAPLLDGRIDWLWADAEKAGLPIMALVPHALLPAIDRIAERHPALKLALCHFSLANDTFDAEAFGDFDRLLALAARPNIMVKASALPCYTRDRYPFLFLHTYIRRAFDAFGPGRLMWGSDLSRLPCPYHESVDLFTQELPWLSADDLDAIMGRNLCKWLGWPLAAD